MFFWTHWTESSSFQEGDTQSHKDKSTDTSSAKDVIQRDIEDSRQSKEFGQIYRPSHMAPKSPMRKKLVRSFYEIIEWSNTRCNMERTRCYSTYTWFLRNQHMVQEVSLAQLAMGVDVQPRHPGSNPHGCEFGFLLFI
jgi:hypothetical protein